MTSHDVRIHIDRINRLHNPDAVIGAEDIKDVATIAFRAVRDKNLIIGNIHSPCPVVLTRDGLTQKFIPLFRPVTSEARALPELIHRLVHRLAHCGGERLCHVADPTSDQTRCAVRIRIRIGFDATIDFRKQVAGFEFKVVGIEKGHGTEVSETRAPGGRPPGAIEFSL